MIKVPVLTLRDVVVMPGVTVYFEVGREKTVAALEAAMSGEQLVFAVAQRDPSVEEPGVEELFEMGTLSQVKQIVRMPGKIIRVVLVGERRAKLQYLETVGEYQEAAVEAEPDLPQEDFWSDDSILTSDGKRTYQLEIIAMVRELKRIFSIYASEHGKLNQQVVETVMDGTDLSEMIYQITANIPVHYHLKQSILDESDLKKRYEALAVIINREIGILKIQGDIAVKVKSQVEENQKEYYLREQIKAIHKELGDEDTSTESDRFLEQLSKLKAPKKVKHKISEEIRRFKLVSSNSSESAVIRGYIETLLAMPWKKTSKDNLDIHHASEILDADHYGLSKVKERVLECLAVKKLKEDGASPIICLVGPPGTGKTSIARSVAKAMNRKYVRICLGGVRDEAEIRGHRRTYVGAMPGRIAQGLKNARVKNPLMLLDEVDKLASDVKGDPSSALLEVLDPEQNKNFSDHYIELSLDLSQVLFICTANSLDTIPRPLLDRMEVIEVAGYTENEKFHIAKDHLWQKQCEKNGLKKQQISITDKALRRVILNYTKEAGVRGLERKIASLCRKGAKAVAEEKGTKIRISDRNLEEYLGKPLYQQSMANEKPEIGVVRGLAWTSVGGDTLEIEVSILPGSGKLELTGKLGEVMQESAKIALTLVKSRVYEKVAEDYFKKHDIHVHVPEGAVPKDGPSAGVTMATAIYSAILELPVRPDIAMTGEVTLRGRVLPIGGLKEKLLAAKAAGICLVMVPEKNKKDIQELEAEVLEGTEIRFAAKIEDIWKVAVSLS
ncbi:MAG: endopeptidase La [Lachnospiraceae bacterium]|nr:endopeptidase La [Lachnospiraceae bacterium]